MTATDLAGTRLRAGQRFECAYCRTNVVVLDAGTAMDVPRCDGTQMTPGPLIRCSEPDQGIPGAVQSVAGTVYADEATGMKVRITRSGPGVMTVHGRDMVALPPPEGRWRRLGTAISG
jgi:hypothetical protein